MRYVVCEACGCNLPEETRGCFNCGSTLHNSDTRAYARGARIATALIGAVAGGLFAAEAPGVFVWGFGVAALGLLGAYVFDPPAKGERLVTGLTSLTAMGALLAYDDIGAAASLAGVFGALLCGYGGYRLGGRIAEDFNAASAEDSGPCLMETEKTVDERIAALSDRSSAVRKLMKDMDERDGDEWREARVALDPVLAAVERELSAWMGKRWTIRLIRWRNRIEPLAVGFDTLDADGARRRIADLDGCISEGRRLAVDMEQVFPPDSPDGEECLDRMRAALAAAEELRGQLMLHQATGLAKTTSPARSAAADGVAVRGKRDVLGARVAANRIFSEVRDLERESERVGAESDAVASARRLLERRV